MSVNQTAVQNLNSDADRFKRCIDAYNTSMRSVIKTETVLNPEKLMDDHYKTYDIATEELEYDEKLDLRFLLDEHFLNIVEQKEDLIWQNSRENSLCIYFTDEWIYVVGYMRKLGEFNINFGNKNGKPGFAPQIKHNDGKLAWGEDYGNLIEDTQGKSLKVDNLYSVMRSAYTGNQKNGKLIKELFERVKGTAEGRMKEIVSQMILVTSIDFNFLSDRKFLRDCCIETGFNRVLIVSDYSLAASMILSKLQLEGPNLQLVSVLIAVIFGSWIILYIFGDDENNGAQLLTTAECYPATKDNVESGYKRACAQMPTNSRDSTRFYVVLNKLNDGDQEKIVDEVLQGKENITKSENIVGTKLKEVFSHFWSIASKQKTIGSAKPQTRMNTASSNLTLKRLKEEFMEFRPVKQDHELRLEVSSKNTDNKNISENLQQVRLIGNCVALKNGTEAADVKDIKKGSWVASRLDLESLTIGEVLVTCKIKDYGDAIYVGVKFRKDLALGTSEIKIVHAKDRSYCDKCKGRRFLFIPSELIGNTKDHVFQLQ